MPVGLQNCEFWGLSTGEVEQLWHETRIQRDWPDDEVIVRCVGAREIKHLNLTYRHLDKPTNILAFSYGDGQHDLAVCPEIIDQEFKHLGKNKRTYIAWILVHGMLHVTGMDHEKSREDAVAMAEQEKIILQQTGFRS